MPTAYHMVHYRKFTSDSDEIQGIHLEELCRRSLSVKNENNTSLWQRAEDRLFDLGDASGRQIILNKVADLSSAIVGEMCLVQKKGLQAFLELNATKVQLSNITLAEIFNLDEKTAPSGTQFIRGMAYWMIIGNHLFFIRIQAMTPDLLNNYLDWMLRSCSPVIGSSTEFKLQAEFDKSEVGGDVGEVRSLRISGISTVHRTVIDGDEASSDRTVSTSRLVRASRFTFEKAQDVAEVMFGKARTDSLIESLGPNEFLAADASIKIQGRRTIQSRNKMKDLARELDNLTEAKVQVEGKDGSFSGGDAILRTRMPFNVSHDGTNFLDFDNVADQIQVVYSRFVEDKKIVV